MAILRNIISSGSRKSAGEATFRLVRGRTIMSQKRGPSAAAAQTRAAAGLIMTRREAIFALAQVVMQVLAADIDASFSKTQFGSARNHFFKVNYAFFAELFGSNWTSPDTDDLNALGMPEGTSLLNMAMTSEGFLGRFKAWCAAPKSAYIANGARYVFYKDAWNDGGAVLKYVRADINGVVEFGTTAQAWQDYAAVLPVISTMLVNLHSAAAGVASNYIETIGVTGSNLSALSTSVVKVGSTTLPGTWNAGVFTPTSASSRTFSGSEIVTINVNGVAIVSQQVTFSSGSSAGGE